MSILIYNVCPWQAFIAQPNVCGESLAYYEHKLIYGHKKSQIDKVSCRTNTLAYNENS
jgi:hypothetical protein